MSPPLSSTVAPDPHTVITVIYSRSRCCHYCHHCHLQWVQMSPPLSSTVAPDPHTVITVIYNTSRCHHHWHHCHLQWVQMSPPLSSLSSTVGPDVVITVITVICSGSSVPIGHWGPNGHCHHSFVTRLSDYGGWGKRQAPPGTGSLRHLIGSRVEGELLALVDTVEVLSYMRLV